MDELEFNFTSDSSWSFDGGRMIYSECCAVAVTEEEAHKMMLAFFAEYPDLVQKVAHEY
jgi:hypothetical protein